MLRHEVRVGDAPLPDVGRVPVAPLLRLRASRRGGRTARGAAPTAARPRGTPRARGRSGGPSSRSPPTADWRSRTHDVAGAYSSSTRSQSGSTIRSRTSNSRTASTSPDPGQRSPDPRSRRRAPACPGARRPARSRSAGGRAARLAPTSTRTLRADTAGLLDRVEGVLAVGLADLEARERLDPELLDRVVDRSRLAGRGPRRRSLACAGAGARPSPSRTLPRSPASSSCLRRLELSRRRLELLLDPRQLPPDRRVRASGGRP